MTVAKQSAPALKADPTRHDLELMTPRLLLRDVIASDTDVLVRYRNEPESHANVLRKQRNPSHNAKYAAVAAVYARRVPWHDREIHKFAVVLRADDTVIGECGAHYVDHASMLVGWHYGIAHAGRGYATEAAREVLRFAFEDLGVQRILADCHATNAGVIAVLRKLGMRRVGGRWRDWLRGLRYRHLRPTLRHVIHREEFLSHRPSLGEARPR